MASYKFGATLLLLASFTQVYAGGVAKAECYDLAKEQPASLTGMLDYVVFAGPPNFEDVQKGDTPEPSFVLRLMHPICLQGDEFADPNASFRDVQLVETKQVSGELKPLLHRQVTVTLKDQMAAETGHHHEPLVAWVTSIVPASRHMDFIDEYGTAATTIRAFYAALADGQGDVAAAMVIPEKRANGPFSAAELTRFYGRLKTPISLEDIAMNNPNEFVVHYRYTNSAHTCDGRAVVKTVVIRGRNYIKSIRALDHC